MARGRKPVPTAVLAARGSWRAKSREGEPVPERGIPTCLGYLSETAKAEWRRVTKELDRMRIMATSDRAMLEIYCVAYATGVEAQNHLAAEGHVVDGKPNPWVRIGKNAMETQLRIGVEFGLTPSSRARIRVPANPAKADNPALKYLAAELH